MGRAVCRFDQCGYDDEESKLMLVTGYTFIMPHRRLAPSCWAPCLEAEATGFQVWGWHLEEREWQQLDIVPTMAEAKATVRRWEEVTALDLALQEG
jgi:hypothetical protein